METKCKDLVADYWASTKEDIERMLILGETEYSTEWDCYASFFDYVEPDTFRDQPEGYYRLGMMGGGPSDEIRFLADGRAEYWYMDWFDGACIDVTNEPAAQAVKQWARETGLMEKRT